MSSVNTAKKLVIKPFKSQPKLPDNYEETTWSRLRTAVDAVLKKTTVSISKEELYQAVEDLCKHKFGGSIYEKLKLLYASHIDMCVAQLNDQTANYASFLAVVDSLWKDHIEQINTIRNIFLYLDRSFALQTAGILPIWELGLASLRTSFERRDDITSKLMLSLFAAVEGDRRGLAVDKDVLARLIRMLVLLGFYVDRFEAPLLHDSVRFFIAEGQSLLESSDIALFLQHVDNRLHEADVMTTTYLDPRTKSALFHVIEQHMLAPHLCVIVDKGLRALLDDIRQIAKGGLGGSDTNTAASTSSSSSSSASASSFSTFVVALATGNSGDKFQDLKRMFLLLERVNSSELLRQGWIAYLRKIGEVLVLDANRDATMIEDLLDFQEKMEDVLKKSFGNQDGFRVALKNAFENFINLRQNKPAELLAKFVDKKMRGEKGLNDGDMESSLDKVMMLFRHLQSKDIFEAFYKKLLAKRLLLGKSANYEIEKSMLSKLKTECGPNYTSKLEGMFQDIELSRDFMQGFSEHRLRVKQASMDSSSDSQRNQVDFHVQVLTTGYWPTPPTTESLVIPPELLSLQEFFLSYYNSKYQGRRIVWSHNLERCVVTARFPKGKKELEVSCYQALVLLCFNQQERLDLNAIRTATNINVDELQRTLLSLACGPIGTRVLRKEPGGKDVLPGDTFCMNKEFVNKLFRIKINTIQLKETSEEAEKTHEEVFRDRQYQVDAVIVRTMKSRKSLNHNTLISELLTQLKFPARTSDLKKRIESLIEREYLARDKDDSSLYIYLA